MGLFGKKIPPPPPPPQKPKGPSITQADRVWVERSFKYIINVFGFSGELTEQINFSEKYFPQTFKNKTLEANALVEDLCNYLSLDIKRITVEYEKDIRDMPLTPYQVSGNVFHSNLEIVSDTIIGNRYYVQLANQLKQNQDLLLIRLIIELLKIKLAETKANLNIESVSNPFMYMLGIYFGFGYILSTKLYEIGVEYRAGWQRTWKFNSGVPPQMMAYGLAFFAIIQNNGYPEWVEKLSQQMIEEFDLSIEFLSAFDVDVFIKEEKPQDEFIADEIMKQVQRFYSENNFEAAISEIRKVILLTNNSRKLASRYCSLGYYYLRLKKYEESIPYFVKSLECKPDFGYSWDNLGFAYIMTGKFEEGKESIEKAMATGSDDKAYSQRNLGIYHMKKNEMEDADECFQKAFEMKTKVDLLEYFCAQFLFQKGNKKEGLRYLEMAVANGEPEAVEFMDEVGNV